MAGFAGNSGGALAADAIAVEHPELVQTLIILDSNNPDPRDPSTPRDFYSKLEEGALGPLSGSSASP